MANTSESRLRYIKEWTRKKRAGLRAAGLTCRGKQPTRNRSDTPLADRLWPFVDKGGACWIWTRGVNDKKSGYGLVSIGNGEQEYAHVLAWQLTYGSANGLFVCHTCDNPPCCNPSHLFLGTAKDNSADCAAKGRAHRGSRNGTAKLNEEQVREIRLLANTVTRRKIADQYGVSLTTIRHILNGDTWSWLP